MLGTESHTALEQMIERFGETLARSPENPTILLGFAEANLRRGRRLQALQAYQKVLEVSPDVADAHLAVAQIYFLHGLPLEAYDELKNVLELEPGRPEAHLLILEIEPMMPVPESLHGLRRKHPTELQVAETRSRLSLERDHLLREVEQLRPEGEASTSEPVATYHLEQAKKRLARTTQLLTQLDSIPLASQVAEEEPPPVRPDFLAPSDEPEGTGAPLLAGLTLPGDLGGLELPQVPEPDAPPPGEPDSSLVGLLDLPDLPVLPGQDAPAPAEPEADELADFLTDLSVQEAPEVQDEEPGEPELPGVPMGEVVEPTPLEPAGHSPARLQFYQNIAGTVRAVVEDLLKTRGLTSIFVVSSLGHVVAHSAKDSLAPESVGGLVREALACTGDFASDLQYWVLECEGGIFLMQHLDPGHVLVAVGQAGASFAMIRLNLDRARPRLAEPLSGAPQD